MKSMTIESGPTRIDFTPQTLCQRIKICFFIMMGKTFVNSQVDITFHSEVVANNAKNALTYVGRSSEFKDVT